MRSRDPTLTRGMLILAGKEATRRESNLKTTATILAGKILVRVRYHFNLDWLLRHYKLDSK